MVARSRAVDRAAGVLLLAGGFASSVGAYMYGRYVPVDFLETAHLETERGSFIAGMVLSALGFCLLDGRRYRPGAYVFMRLGVAGYLAGSIIGVVAETLELTSTAVYPMIVVYVTLAFVSQAAIGCALSLSELVPRWIGWATVVWNIGCLTYLVLARPWDVYFPIFHLIMPVFIGAALILRRRRESAPEADLADIQVG
jgi:hypothetical protein